MGFCSRLIFYRPRTPPIITGKALADFMRRFGELGLSNSNGRGMLELKFGKSIDQDEQLSWWIVPTTSESIGTVEDIDWDIEQFAIPVRESMNQLTQFEAPLYRAHVGLGAAVDAKVESLRRRGSPENSEDYLPDEWSVQIDRIECGRDGEFFIGWFAIGLGGNGYLYPWTLRNLIDRAEQVPEIQELMKLCRETWPVPPEPVPLEVQDGRKQMGPYWPYDELDKPWDWYWGLQGLLS